MKQYIFYISATDDREGIQSQQVSMTSESDGNAVIDGEVNIIANAGKTCFDGSDASSFEFISQAQVNAAKAAARAAEAAMAKEIYEKGMLDYRISNDTTYSAFAAGNEDAILDKLAKIASDPTAEHDIARNPTAEGLLRQMLPNLPTNSDQIVDYLNLFAADHGITLNQTAMIDQKLIDLCTLKAPEYRGLVKERDREFQSLREGTIKDSFMAAAETEGISVDGAWPFMYEINDPFNSPYIHEEGTPGIANAQTIPAYLSELQKKNGNVKITDAEREPALAIQQLTGIPVTGLLSEEDFEWLQGKEGLYQTGELKEAVLDKNMVKLLQVHAPYQQQLVGKGGIARFIEANRGGVAFFRHGVGAMQMAAIACSQMPKRGPTTAKRKAKSETQKPATPEQLEKQAIKANSSENVSEVDPYGRMISARTQSILDKVKNGKVVEVETGNGNTSMIRVVDGLSKGEVKVNDLGNLQAATGREYTLLRGPGGARVLIEGNPTEIAIPTKYVGNGWKWSGHSHPYSTTPSSADLNVLAQYGQEQSMIKSALTGEEKVFSAEDGLLSNWLP